MKIAISWALLTCSCAFAQQAEFGKPLQDEYWSDHFRFGKTRFFNTGETATGYEIACDMGQALPDVEREGWYTNLPIDGLRLELRAVAVDKFDPLNDLRTYGFVLFVKNGEVLKQFQPFFLRPHLAEWSGKGTDYNLSSTISLREGIAEFDLIDGNGLYRETSSSDPKYFLSNCKKTEKQNLPVYDHEFGVDEKEIDTQE